ncbi:MAG TPA: hypothetical protein VEX41_08765 [Candidatus Eisenbacteria bacterium]|nr:hypothetical protein [Candidatus Eisenbacteria bacterium]
MPTNHEIVERYAHAITHSLDELDRLRHPDYVEDWPQSGERIRGAASMRAIDEHYPDRPTQDGVLRVVGSEDRWVVTPSYTTLRIEGTGDVYTIVSRAIYPPDSVWYVTSIVQLRDQLVWRATTFFAKAFEAPAWRAQWVGPIEPNES